MNIMISSNDIYEYFYCPREVYFMKKLLLPSEKRKMHFGLEEQEREGKRLLERKDIFGFSREEIIAVEKNKYLESKEIDLCGIMDLLITLKTGEMIPVDIKYTDHPYLNTSRVKQIMAYSLLIDRCFNSLTKRGIIYYPKQNKQDLVKISQSDKETLLSDLNRIKRILTSDKIPRKTASSKCTYCGYLKICGSIV